MAFDPTFMAAALDEVRQRCLGARVDKIHQPSRDTLILHLRCREGREKLLFAANPTAPRLHRDTINMVKATAQAKFVEKLLPLLDEEELSYYRRGKNAHVHAVPKSCTPAEYAKATGLEALFGALYLLGRTDRINELFKTVMEGPHGL
jgi:ribonuclease-3 family protein